MVNVAAFVTAKWPDRLTLTFRINARLPRKMRDLDKMLSHKSSKLYDLLMKSMG
jgi:hypothetical protein